MLATSLSPIGGYEDNDDSLDESQRDTTQLIPTTKHEHHVWVQGRLAKVRTVSTANLRAHRSLTVSSPGKVDGSTNIELAVGSTSTSSKHRRRRSSMCDLPYRNTSKPLQQEHGDFQNRPANRSLRGYGIGGAGNIREDRLIAGIDHG